MADEHSKILFVINPRAGIRSDDSFENIVRKKSLELDFQYRFYLLSESKHYHFIQREIKLFEPDVVAAVGGDGTCNLVACAVKGTNYRMGIIPTGSANGMAAELNISKRPEEAIDNLIKGVPKRIDTLLINDKELAMHLSDVGLNAHIINRFSKQSTRGLWGYIKYFFIEYFAIKKYRFRITYDNIKIKRRAISITFANASKYGTGAVINPIGKIDDGKFELCIIRPFPWYYLFHITYLFFKGKLEESKFAEIITCSEAKITCKKALALQIDGEIFGSMNKVTAKVIQRSLTIMVPQEQ